MTQEPVSDQASRWRLADHESIALAAIWQAWLQVVVGASYSPGTEVSVHCSVVLRALAEASAALVAAALRGRPPRRRRRVARANQRGRFGASTSVHDRLAEDLANAALGLGLELMRDLLRGVEPLVAANAVAAAVQAAALEVLATPQTRPAIATTMHLEYREALHRLEPAAA